MIMSLIVGGSIAFPAHHVRRFGALLTLLLAAPTLVFLVLLELALAFRLWDTGGRSCIIELRDGHFDADGVFTAQIVEPPPFTAWDWLGFIAFLVALIAATVGLAYLVRRSWRSLRVRQ